VTQATHNDEGLSWFILYFWIWWWVS